MSDLTNERKVQHINIVNDKEHIDRGKNYFDSIRLTHRALPEISIQEVDPSVVYMGKRLSFPLLISSMTGGDHDLVRTINKNCAIAAQKTGVAMGVGSQRVMFKNTQAEKSFDLRSFAPDILLFANLGAVQLNYGFDLLHCKRAIDILDADALYFHLNPLQEAIQPEGDTDFSGLKSKISDIVNDLNVPLIVKEVGAGISDVDAELLIEAGVRYIDVAGTGGTSWSRIENYRNNDGGDLGELFQDWGIPTPVSLGKLAKYHNNITLTASGGVRNGIDMVKSVVLGATLCGIAKPFLKPAMESPDKVIEVIERLKKEFVTAMFLLGMKNIKSLHRNFSLIINWNDII